MKRLRKWLAALAAVAAGTAVLTMETKEASEKLCEAEPALCHRLRCINPDIPVTRVEKYGDICWLLDGKWAQLGREAPCGFDPATARPYPETVYAGEDPEAVASESPEECLRQLRNRLNQTAGDEKKMQLIVEALEELKDVGR